MSIHKSTRSFQMIFKTQKKNDKISDNNRSRSFTLSGNSHMQVNSMVGSGSQGTPNSCTSDWLLIGCARVADKFPQSNICEDRICGGTFNAEIGAEDKTIISNILNLFNFLIEWKMYQFFALILMFAGSVRPFRLTFHADSVEAPNDIDNRGFCLDYVQQPCSNG